MNIEESVEIENSYYSICYDREEKLPYVKEIDGMNNVFSCVSFGKSGMVGSCVGAKVISDAVKEYYPKIMNLLK